MKWMFFMTRGERQRLLCDRTRFCVYIFHNAAATDRCANTIVYKESEGLSDFCARGERDESFNAF